MWLGMAWLIVAASNKEFTLLHILLAAVVGWGRGTAS